jgi:hypothetical protein
VFHLRCTKKLLKRIAAEPEGVRGATNTVLGDWYANIVFSKPQHLVVCISERTLLPIVVPAKNIHGLPQRLCAQLEQLLQLIGVSSAAIELELAQMREHQFAPTASKSVLGSLNESVFHLSWMLSAHRESSLLEHAVRLGDIPNKPIGYAFASEATRSLFKAKQVIADASGVS